MLRFHTSIAALTLLGLAFSARVEAQSLASDFEEKVESKTISQKEFADQIAGNVGFLRLTRDWRDTFRGNGQAPKRNLMAAKIAGYDAKLSLGAVAPPSLSGLNGAGVAASLGAIEIGTTARPQALENAFKEFDEVMTGQKVTLADPQSVTWLRAKPLSARDAEIEFSLVRATRDEKAGDGEKWKSGEFESVNGRLNLPARWKATANLTRAQMQDADAKIQWQTRFEGPIKHPFGEARASAQWSETDAGFGNFSGQNGLGGSVGSAEAAQDLKIGPLTGNLSARGETAGRDNPQSAGVGEEIEKRGVTTGAQLKLGLFAGLALEAKGQWQLAQSEKMGAPLSLDEIQSENPVQSGEIARQNSLDEAQIAGGDVGVSLQLSKATTLGATVGRSQVTNAREVGETWQDLPGNAENRAGLEMRHQTGGGVFALGFSARDRDNDAQNDESWQRLAILKVEAERRLIGSFRLRACANFARDRDAHWSDENGLARRFETGLIFSKASRLDLRYRDGAALPGSLLGDPLGAAFGGLNQSGAQEIAARFNAGSDKGFGVALEYALQRRETENNGTWKVGLTYR